jgi:hypothetical protein
MEGAMIAESAHCGRLGRVASKPSHVPISKTADIALTTQEIVDTKETMMRNGETEIQFNLLGDSLP